MTGKSMSTTNLHPSSASSREKYKWKRCDGSDARSLEESELAVRRPRSSGLMLRENSEDSGVNRKAMNVLDDVTSTIVRLLHPPRVAHRSIASTSGDIHPGNFNAVFLPRLPDDSLNYGTGDTYGYLAKPIA
jgi:hypothetical protein